MSSYWVLMFLALLALLAFAQGTDFSAQPLVRAAASLITIPLGIANALTTTSFGMLLLPVFFILVVIYLNTLHFWLGNEVMYFILFAAALVALSA